VKEENTCDCDVVQRQVLPGSLKWMSDLWKLLSTLGIQDAEQARLLIRGEKEVPAYLQSPGWPLELCAVLSSPGITPTIDQVLAVFWLPWREGSENSGNLSVSFAAPSQLLAQGCI
jgi:hypothetical protein